MSAAPEAVSTRLPAGITAGEPVRTGRRSDNRIVLVLLALGAALRLWQYLANPSLWIDEIALARNILERSAGRLLSPLDYQQVCPAGFLLIQKASTLLLGPSEFALRLIPLIASLASLGFVHHLASRLLAPGARAMAVGLVAISPSLILHGPEVKQYSVDVAVALLIVTLAVRALDRPPSARGSILAGAAGALGAFISLSAVIVLAGAGAAFAGLSLVDRRRIRQFLPMIAIWAIAALAAALWTRRYVSPETQAFQLLCWPHGFLSGPGGVVHGGERLWLALSSVFRGNHYAVVGSFTALALLGFVTLGRRGVLLAAPVAVALALSAIEVYPFDGRLVLYLLPLFLIAAAAGAGWIAGHARRTLRIPLVLSLMVLAAPAIAGILLQAPPYRREETKPLLSWVASQRQEGDAIYVYYGAWQAARFYGPRFGIERADYETGGCHRGEPREYLREIDRFRGERRVWVLIAHEPRGLVEREAIAGYLDAIGRRIDSRSVGAGAQPGVHALLYDLSDAKRLALASAETYPMPKPSLVDPVEIAIGCAGGPQVPQEDPINP